jgi:archaellum component FlaC
MTLQAVYDEVDGKLKKLEKIEEDLEKIIKTVESSLERLDFTSSMMRNLMLDLLDLAQF